MITDIYAHILDDDRRVNAQKFEDAFYKLSNPDLKTAGQTKQEQPAVDVAALLEQLQKSPELLSALADLLAKKEPNSNLNQ